MTGRNKFMTFAAIALALGCRTATAQTLLPTEAGTKVSLNGIWDFMLNRNDGKPVTDAAWRTIKVPANWEYEGVCNPKYGEKLRDIHGTYRRTLNIPKQWNGDQIYLCFEGVQAAYSVWVNGDSIGSFSSSFNRETFNITRAAKPGRKNVLEVKVWTNPKEWAFDTNDDWTLSGIHRDVSLFHLPKTHIEDVTVVTRMDGTVRVETVVEGNSKANAEVTIATADGKVVARGMAGTDIRIPKQLLRLWTAETPYLYTMTVDLKMGSRTLQSYRQKIGIREIGWKDGVMKINGRPIMLKGVNHHDLSATHGRGLNEAELQKDIRLMKEGNINFIRCSHYPPQPRLLELCDSAGIYVLDEVPFGFGDKNLKDSTFLPFLLDRARHTYMRDKNHPSVIIWGVGNENPLTDICREAGQYMRDMDKTRPYCFPQTPGVLKATVDSISDDIELLDYHYPKVADLKEYATKLQGRPMLASEYAHALGLDFGELENTYEEMRRHPGYCGGAVWMMFDQAVLRKSDKPVDKTQPTTYTWLTPDTYYDTNGNAGTDGVMYADRVPQTNYYELRKVFAPVKASDEYDVSNGLFTATMHNRYDFLDLSSVNAVYKVMVNSRCIKEASLPLQCPPRDSVRFSIALPELPANAYCYLTVEMKDVNGTDIYEKSYALAMTSASGIAGNGTLPDYLRNTKVRVERKPTMASTATETSRRSKKLHTLWSPFLQDEGNFKKEVEITPNANGTFTCRYTVTLTENLETVECGLSFVVPKELTQLRYVGNGPYASYNNKQRLSEFGVHHLSTDDIYFPGNRRHVELFAMTDSRGRGFAISAHDADICVEHAPEGTIVSFNSFVAGAYNKYTWPKDIRTYKAGESFSGEFTIIPLGTEWDNVLEDILGAPTMTAGTFAPYYHSYDQ